MSFEKCLQSVVADSTKFLAGKFEPYLTKFNQIRIGGKHDMLENQFPLHYS